MGSADARWASGWRRGLALLSHLAEEPEGELLRQAADRYDALAPRQQARLRRRLSDNAACRASC